MTVRIKRTWFTLIISALALITLIIIDDHKQENFKWNKDIIPSRPLPGDTVRVLIQRADANIPSGSEGPYEIIPEPIIIAKNDSLKNWFSGITAQQKAFEMIHIGTKRGVITNTYRGEAWTDGQDGWVEFVIPNNKQIEDKLITIAAYSNSKQLIRKRSFIVSNNNLKFWENYILPFGWIALISFFVCSIILIPHYSKPR